MRTTVPPGRWCPSTSGSGDVPGKQLDLPQPVDSLATTNFPNAHPSGTTRRQTKHPHTRSPGSSSQHPHDSHDTDDSGTFTHDKLGARTLAHNIKDEREHEASNPGPFTQQQQDINSSHKQLTIQPYTQHDSDDETAFLTDDDITDDESSFDIQHDYEQWTDEDDDDLHFQWYANLESEYNECDQYFITEDIDDPLLLFTPYDNEEPHITFECDKEEQTYIDTQTTTNTHGNAIDEEPEDNIGDEVNYIPANMHNHTILDFINVTSLRKHFTTTMSTNATYTAIAEHTTPINHIAAIKRSFKQADQRIFLSPLHDEAIGESSGVGIAISNNDAKCIPYSYKDPQLKTFYNQGRLASFYINVEGGNTLLTHIIYLWTGSAHNNKAKSRSNDLIDILMNEIQALPTCPQIIIGDMNCEPADIAALQTRVNNGQWNDLGSKAETWGERANLPTCKAQHTGNSHRRDIALANEHAAQLVNKFQVIWDPRYRTHAKL